MSMARSVYFLFVFYENSFFPAVGVILVFLMRTYLSTFMLKKTSFP